MKYKDNFFNTRILNNNLNIRIRRNNKFGLKSVKQTNKMSGAEAFMGSWREEEKEGYEAMVTALGLPEEKKEFFKNARTEITYRRDGDIWEIDVGMQGVPQTRTFRFKPGEQYESASLDGSPMKSVVTVDGDKLQEKHIDDNLNGMDMNITRYIDGGKMIVETQVGDLHMRSIYARI